MAMMASGGSGNPYDHFGNDSVEQDLIDPDDGKTITLDLHGNSTINLAV